MGGRGGGGGREAQYYGLAYLVGQCRRYSRRAWNPLFGFGIMYNPLRESTCYV